MTYLFIIILLCLLTYHYDYQDHKKGRKEWYWCVCMYLIVIAGLRYRIGTDTLNYEETYRTLPNLLQYFDGYDFSVSRFGRGYLFLTALCRSMSPSFIFFQFVHALFITVLIFWFFYKNTKHIFLAALMYLLCCYTLFTFEILRESCAVAVSLIAWNYFKNNNWAIYYLFVIIAILFHPSASILIVLPIFNLKLFRPLFKLGYIFWIGVLVFSVLCAYLSIKFFDLIRLLSIQDVENYANSYENSGYGEATVLSIKGMIFFAIRSFLYPTLAIWMLHKFKREKEANKLEYMVCWFVYMTVASFFINILTRFNNYFWPYVIIAVSQVTFGVIPMYLKRIKLSFGVWSLIIGPYLILLVYPLFSPDVTTNIRIIHKYYPYASVVFPEKDATREALIRSRARP